MCSFSCRLLLFVSLGLRWCLGALGLCLFPCRLLLFVSRGSVGGVLRACCWGVVCRLSVGVWLPWVLPVPCLSACLACLSSSSSSCLPAFLFPLSYGRGRGPIWPPCVAEMCRRRRFFSPKDRTSNPTWFRPAGPPGHWGLGTCTCGCRRGKSVVRGNPSLRHGEHSPRTCTEVHEDLLSLTGILRGYMVLYESVQNQGHQHHDQY